MGVAIQTLQELFDGCIKLGDLTYERLEGGVLQLPPKFLQEGKAMTADRLIAVVSEALNLEGLALNEQRLAAIHVGDMTVTFEEDEDAKWLYVHGEVVDNASALPKEKLLSLLKAHHLFNDVSDASFGISRDDALELFLRVQIVDGLKDDDWAAMFLSFLVSLKEWRTEFGAGSGDEVPEEENQRAGETIEPPESTVDAEGPFGFLGGIRI